MDFDGTGDGKRLVDRGVISQNFDQMHGLGPVWSPDGTRIAFQRSCDFTPDNRPCSEQEEVVVVTVNDNGPPRPDEMPPMLDMAQVVIPPPETPQPDGTTMLWWPFYVTWSPDSTTLLYGAWSDSAIPEQVVPIAVRVDHQSPPVVLSPTSNLAPYDGVLRLHYQSWSRQQG